ncbi:MAG: hypothetical protein M5Z89_23895, partial [Olivibacter sp.]|nr:hypothetical protein [Olivibacter sp. UJ_SKK_5.1]
MEIPVFSANLIDRTDRKEHIQLEYRSFPEFKMTIIPAIRENHGAVGLWKTLKLILTERVSDELDFFIFCEDDHIFTEVYSIDFLIKCINDAKKHKADVLLGGISWFDMAVQISDELFWVNSFSGTQFVVFFRKFYKKMRGIDDFQFHDTIDQKIGELS